jgi:crotonobetainyl-CoA:carnitine CoA-transferase CaiB-like acyl-CoA transferase
MTDSVGPTDEGANGMSGALEGIRVIDAGIIVQGPQAGAALGDLGADVVKVELPDFGDQARWIPVAEGDGRAPYFIACNRGKRSVTVDLRTEGGREVLLDLLDTADVLISNFKPGTLDDWGLGYEVCAERNRGLVYATGSVFGPHGPDATREGADLAGQAAGGLISTTGVDGGDPTPVGATIADHIASQNMVSGILAALIARGRTGRGQRVDVSLLGGQIWAQASEYTAFFLTGQIPGRANYSHPLLHAAYGIVPTADGWIAIVGVPPAGRTAFYEAIGLPELADDERFQPFWYTEETKQALFAVLREVFVKKTTAEWAEPLTAAGCRWAAVQDYAQAAADPHVWANGYVVEGEHPEWGKLPMVGSPIAMSDTPVVPGHWAPELGQHTEEVLLELGYSWERIAELRDAKAI